MKDTYIFPRDCICGDWAMAAQWWWKRGKHSCWVNKLNLTRAEERSCEILQTSVG